MNAAGLLVLILAASLDYRIGDPVDWIHPVQIMGWAIAKSTSIARHFCQQKWQRRGAGIVIGLFIIVISGLVPWLMIQFLKWLNPLLAIIAETVLLASCFALKSLRQAAGDVMDALSSEIDTGRCALDAPAKLSPLALKEARSRLSNYVGRDTDNLDETEINRAILETVAENTTDGVTAPLFYALVGALIPAVGSVPLALAYKAASTLDSTIGYRNEPYIDIGWFSAKLEDCLTWLPCRLTVLTLALLSGKPKLVWQTCIQDGSKDPSPNSGWSEAAFAAILGVQLGGVNFYGGVPKSKPLLGEPTEPITSGKIIQALDLARSCFLLWLSIGCLLLIKPFL